ncbi:hypothetical protein Lal_00012795 [Lupinus albus]|nr:hypothetical protein Lal_00012795 [Lupinus albus]
MRSAIHNADATMRRRPATHRQRKLRNIILSTLELSLYGRKGLPNTTSIPLLNSSYSHYDVGICIVLDIVIVGSVVLTIFLNFNVILKHHTFSTSLKVHVQLTGAEQVLETLSTTLHHQIIYRL